jgi:muconate cycloisomerase
VKIRAIRTYPLILPISEVYGGAAGVLDDCRTLIIRLDTDNGIEGWGEATQGRPGNTYETLETMDVMVRQYFAPALIGLDLEQTGAVINRLQAVRCGHPIAKAGIETALYDTLAKAYQLPLYRLLGGPYRGEIELVGGLGIELSAQAIGARARQLWQDGCRTFKLKIGQKVLANDIARVRAVREAVGDQAILRVDGNASYSFIEARTILNALSPYGLADAEQPLARAELKSLAELRRCVGVPIAVQESVSSPEDAVTVLEAGAADLLKIKLTHIGGFQKALQVAAVVGARGLAVVVGQGSACTPILSAAEMHLHAVLNNAQSGGEMTGFQRLGAQEFISGISVSQCKVKLSEAPGHGVAVDAARLEGLSSRVAA